MTPEEKIAHLEGQLKEVRDESADRRVKSRELKQALDKATADLADRDGRLAEFEKKQGKPSELQARIDELTGQIRGLKHSARFKEIATAAGIPAAAIGDAWKILDLKADADEPDDAAMTAAIDDARESRSYLFAAPGEKPAPVVPKFGGGKGKEPPAPKAPTPEQLRDPAYAMAQYEATKAARAGR